jgi:hypothetical protein
VPIVCDGPVQGNDVLIAQLRQAIADARAFCLSPRINPEASIIQMPVWKQLMPES